jgi:DNA primase
MAEEWLSYSDLGERLNISPEAARQRAIRARWPRRTANDGKAQVKVDVADVLAVTPQRRANDCATPDQPPVEPLSDTRTIDALTAHLATLRTDYLATLRELVFKADALVIHEREQVDAERQRADRERVRADAERDRADHLAARLETLLVEKAEAAEKGTEFERQLAELKALVDQMRSRPWWRRLRLIVPQPFVPAYRRLACVSSGLSRPRLDTTELSTVPDETGSPLGPAVSLR